MTIFEKKLILGSQSPRRKQLLEQAGFTFDVHPLHVDESFPQDMDVYKVAEFLAVKKGRAGRHLLNEEEILITADSVVIMGNTIFNKPESFEEAQTMIRTLSGKPHEVCTGVCLLTTEKEIHFTGYSKVFMDELTEEEITYYIERFQPFDKAGAYGIQEWIGLCKISKIEGTYANVMGLPTDLLYKHLLQL